MRQLSQGSSPLHVAVILSYLWLSSFNIPDLLKSFVRLLVEYLNVLIASIDGRGSSHVHHFSYLRVLVSTYCPFVLLSDKGGS